MRLRVFLIGFFSLILSVVPLSVGLVTGASTALADGNCQTAGSTGLNALIVATSGQHITGTVDATGCDVGIYVGAGITNVEISNATVENANDHGIYVQDTSNILILNNTLNNNVVNQPTEVVDGQSQGTIPENKAIALNGADHVVIQGNTITNTVGSGGISINDDGAIAPGALPGHAGMARPSEYNFVLNNQVLNNPNDCGIVLAAYNPGQGVNHNLVMGNTVKNSTAGIVVAADPPGTEANANKVVRNTVSDNVIPGIIVHSNAPGDSVTGTVVMFNTVSNNGADGEVGLEGTIGIVLAGNTFGPNAPAATVTHSVVMFNFISNEHYGVAIVNGQQNFVGGTWFNHADVPVYQTP